MAAGRPSVRATSGVGGYFVSTRSGLVSAAVTIPLLLLYNLGLLVPGNREMNAADLLSFAVAAGGPKVFLAVNGVLLVTSLVLIGVLVRKGLFRPGHWLLLGLEGLLYGLLLGQGVVWVLGKAHVLAVAGAPQRGILQVLSLSAGAGYWEELVFRLLLVGGPIALAGRIAKGRPLAARVVTGCLAVTVSSFLFSLAHYIGSESFDPYSFWYRALSGYVFAAIFLTRGFGVAAYTHFLYDVIVML